MPRIGKNLGYLPVTEPRDDYTPLVKAMQWSSRITTIAIEMVLPGLFGFWLDKRLGTGFLFLLVGVAVGFSVGLWSLLEIAKSRETGRNDGRKTPQEKR